MVVELVLENMLLVYVRFSGGNRRASAGVQWEHFLCAEFGARALSCMLAVFTFLPASLSCGNLCGRLWEALT